MNVIKTAIPEILIIEPKVYGDPRGFFMESYHQSKFAEVGIQNVFIQDNHSGSQQGTLRGLHYQLRQPQGKLVRVVVGEVFDAAVDIRQGSSTFGKWVGTVLSAENHRQLWIPPGFAHGFYVLSKWAELLYKVTDFYAPQWDRTILWNDPAIGIDWPLLDQQVLLSQKDAAGVKLVDAEIYAGPYRIA